MFALLKATTETGSVHLCSKSRPVCLAKLLFCSALFLLAIFLTGPRWRLAVGEAMLQYPWVPVAEARMCVGKFKTMPSKITIEASETHN